MSLFARAERVYLLQSMLRVLRSRCVAFTTLVTFMLAQPVVLCATLCLLEGHHAGAHAMPGMNGGSPSVDKGLCHTTTAGTVQRDPFQVLSPMEPAHAPVIAIAPARRVYSVPTIQIAPRLVFQTAEPPPPRFV